MPPIDGWLCFRFKRKLEFISKSFPSVFPKVKQLWNEDRQVTLFNSYISAAAMRTLINYNFVTYFGVNWKSWKANLSRSWGSIVKGLYFAFMYFRVIFAIEQWLPKSYTADLLLLLFFNGVFWEEGERMWRGLKDY